MTVITSINPVMAHLWPPIFPIYKGSIQSEHFGIVKEYIILKNDDELNEAVEYLRLWCKFKCRDFDKEYFEDIFVYRPSWNDGNFTQPATAAVKVFWVGKKLEAEKKDG